MFLLAQPLRCWSIIWNQMLYCSFNKLILLNTLFLTLLQACSRVRKSVLHRREIIILRYALTVLEQEAAAKDYKLEHSFERLFQLAKNAKTHQSVS